MSAQDVKFIVTAGALPAGACLTTWDDVAAAIAEILVVTPDVAYSSFYVGSAAPTSDVGPWFKSPSELLIWDNDFGMYKDIASIISAANRMVKTNAVGKIDDSFLNNPISILNTQLAATIATSATYATLCSIAATITTGMVIPVGIAQIQENAGTTGQPCGIQLWDGTAALGASAKDISQGGGGGSMTDDQIVCFGKPDLSPSGKTYSLRGIATNANSFWKKSGASIDDAQVLITEGTQLFLIQIGV